MKLVRTILMIAASLSFTACVHGTCGSRASCDKDKEQCERSAKKCDGGEQCQKKKAEKK